MLHPDKKKALFYAKRHIAQIVTDVVNLEEIPFTVPEIQTLLDGVTVGGHRIEDTQIAMNQIKSWRFLFDALEKNAFALEKEFVCSLHGYVAYQEALTWGQFRQGAVTISGTSFVPPPSNQLPELWDQMLLQAGAFSDAYEKSTFVFAHMARSQFFFDGNKRTGRMVMAGLLIDAGFPIINVPAKRKYEFHKAMIDFYENPDMKPVHHFLMSCLDPLILQEFRV